MSLTPRAGHRVRNGTDVSWWVTPAAYQRGYYDKLYAALQSWIAGEFPSSRPYYSNIAIPSA